MGIKKQNYNQKKKKKKPARIFAYCLSEPITIIIIFFH